MISNFHPLTEEALTPKLEVMQCFMANHFHVKGAPNNEKLLYCNGVLLSLLLSYSATVFLTPQKNNSGPVSSTHWFDCGNSTLVTCHLHCKPQTLIFNLQSLWPVSAY